ncbi:MAG: hypothetical protein DA408_14675 [Bacteroidetes bacterium]|nr:MAG: hypothetical protein C7N36_11200 [Bacteroidota bacterium]PTM11035.1 MAG: hypothetical protein DA408_14675 [Bacteroidota bacterium]
MEDVLNKIWEQILAMTEVIPSLITAFFIFLVGLILAKVFRRIIQKVLVNSGIDKLADRLNEIDIVASTSVSIVPSQIVASIVYYIILFVFIMAAVEVLGMETISNLLTDLINYFPKAISAFFVFIIGILLSDLLKKVVQTACESLGIGSAKLLANVAFYFLFLNVALITMKQAELQTTFMENNISIVLAGVILAFSIGYGLASKSLMSNMLAAYYNKDRFEIGDDITIDGQRGKVIGIDNTTLSLRVTEGEVIVPLSKLSDNQYTIHRSARFTPLDEPEEV